MSYSLFYISQRQWCAQTANPSTEWIQAGSSEFSIFLGIKTQGRSNLDQWVAEYELHYSDDGLKWFKAFHGKRFEGNSDRDTIKEHIF